MEQPCSAAIGPCEMKDALVDTLMIVDRAIDTYSHTLFKTLSFLHLSYIALTPPVFETSPESCL